MRPWVGRCYRGYRPLNQHLIVFRKFLDELFAVNLVGVQPTTTPVAHQHDDGEQYNAMPMSANSIIRCVRFKEPSSVIVFDNDCRDGRFFQALESGGI